MMPSVGDVQPNALALGHMDVECVSISPELLLWCGSASATEPHMLYACAYAESQPYPRVVAELAFAPKLISVLGEKIVVVGESAVVLYTWSFASPPRQEMNGVGGEMNEEGIVVAEEFICDGIPCSPTHVSWAPDGSAASISSPRKLCLLDCRLGVASDDTAPPSMLLLDCSRWYSDTGAILSALSPSTLFALSRANHLVSIRYDADWNVDPVLERDGHILARSYSVTSLAIGGSEEGHLVVGFSDGTVKLLLQDTLEVFFTLDVTKQLYRGRELPSKLVAEGGAMVVTVAVGRQFMVVMRRDAVACYSRSSMEFLGYRAVFFAGRGSLLTAASADGSWCAWSPGAQELLYFDSSVAGHVDGGEFGKDAVDDIMHAKVSLPQKLLEPLRLPSKQLPQCAVAPLGVRSTIPRGTGHLVSKPVTFGRPVKSSGYTSDVPWSVQQQVKKRREIASKAPRVPSTVATLPRYKPLPISHHPFKPMTSANKILTSTPIHSAAVTSATFTTGGGALLTASGDKTANFLKYPVAKHGGDGILMRVHTAPVNTIDTSMSIKSPIVATGSADGTVAVWRPTSRASPYIVHAVHKDVRTVKFFYTDKFLCCACGNAVSLYKYALDDGGGDIDRTRNESRMRSVVEFTPPDTQHVVAVDAINYFTSNIIVWAGSNKAVGVYDVAAERFTVTMAQAHERPIHHVAMLTAGRYASAGVGPLHTFLTAGMDNTVRLWDVRQQRSVRHFAQHRNSAAPVGVAFSPNGALVAAGSENRSVYLYDVGTSAVLDKLAVSDVPTSICWHPIENVLAVGAASGAVQFMGQR
ncbi:WD domain [Trypanosoma vivax]|nr:WD domain [Trypanosoma vivax]